MLKINCKKSEIFDVISNVCRSVAAKSTIPALEGILLSAKGDRLFLSAYDLDMGMSSSIEARVLEEGEIVLTAKLFVDMVRRMAGEDVCIETDEKLLTQIKCGLTEFTILGMPAGEFPEIPQITDSSALTVPQNMLKSMIDQTLFAIATNDSKPVYTGSLFEFEDGVFSIVSVDGVRLALRREKLSFEEALSFVVPGKTLSEISKLLDGEEDTPVDISASHRHIVFQVNGYSVVSRLLDGEFLDYKAAIPPSAVSSVVVNKREFMDSIERTSLLISDRLKSPLRIKFEDHTIKMSCSTAIGKAYDELSCKVDGYGVEMGFNNRYLLDALRASDCDEVKLEISGALSPMKVVPINGDHFLFLILPVRLKAE